MHFSIDPPKRFASRVAQSVVFIIDRARSLPAIARMKARDLVVFSATSRALHRALRVKEMMKSSHRAMSEIIDG